LRYGWNWAVHVTFADIVTVAVKAAPAEAHPPPHKTPVLGAVGVAVSVTEVAGAYALEQLTGVEAEVMVQLMPLGALTTFPYPVVCVLNCVVRVKLLQPDAGGEAPDRQGSVPCNVTVAVGDPVDVVNVQLPVPGEFATFKFAVTIAVV
jgi:hypothetical protein